MLCPEVWNFSPPPYSFRFSHGNYKSQTELLNNSVKSHYFNHMVSVVLPDTVLVPKAIIETLSEDCEYYKLENVGLDDFIKIEFIEAFVKKGQLTALSVDTHIDTDNCVALTPSGHLILSLRKETYEELGLEGKPSFFCRRKPTRFVVTLDLKADHFKPGKKNYERVKWCFSNKADLKFSFVLAWDPPDIKICPSSVAAYLDSEGIEVSVCHPQFIQRRDYDVKVPLLSSEESDSCEPMELIEWLGAYSIEADLNSGTPDNFLTTYQCPEPNKTFGQVAYLQWAGLFTCSQIQTLLEAVSNYLSLRSSIPWGSIHVQGFEDSPVSWGLKEHQYYTNGDNMYTLILQPDGNFLTCSALSSNKCPSRKS